MRSQAGSICENKPPFLPPSICRVTSKGKILYGYGHEESYWYDRNNISAEGWAQFGRIQFVNNTMVMQMLTELFPSFTKDAILALKGDERNVEREDN